VGHWTGEETHGSEYCQASLSASSLPVGHRGVHARKQLSQPPITMVVPCRQAGRRPLCRFAAEKASGALASNSWSGIVPAAGRPVSTEAVLRSPPDGYTLLCAPQLAYSITHLVFAKAAFDTRAMEPISVLATYPLIVIARANLPVGNLAEFIAYARANPGKVRGHRARRTPAISSASS
jgi:tripartite-type tricarboxylate transporter receptor subunit TctC